MFALRAALGHCHLAFNVTVHVKSKRRRHRGRELEAERYREREGEREGNKGMTHDKKKRRPDGGKDEGQEQVK